MNQIRKRRGIESESFLRYRGDQLGAGLVVGLVKHVLARLLLELLGVGRSQKRTLMMVEPPGDFWRIGIFEVHDDVFIAVEDAVFPGLRRAVSHAGKLKFSDLVELLPIKAVKESGGSRAVKAAIVETEP